MWRWHCVEDMVIKLLLGVVTAAGLIAACGGSGTAADSTHVARPATAGSTAKAASTAKAGSTGQPGPPSNCLVPPATCYAPRVFRTAYAISPLLARGIDGRGQTVVLPEVAEQPGGDTSDIRQDMALFDSMFGLPAARLQVVNSLAASASPWVAGGEEAQDAEMVHAVAPGAAVSIVLIKPSALNSAAAFVAAMTAFMRLGATQGGVLSVSASIGEHYLTPAEVASMDAALRADRDHDVTVVAASGDKGAASDLHLGSTTPVKEVSLPASDPWVLAAGATRGVPDVAGDAAFDTGLAVVDGKGSFGQAFVRPATGTSAAAPFWAGLVALADQLAHRHLGFINPAIYSIARGPDYHAAFHDITAGDNTFALPPATITGYSATPGWDPVTGWGTPGAAVLVPLLARS
jgi:subtilase family serine protease